MTLRPIPLPATDPTATEYPESDGRPMAETDLHRAEMTDLIAMLEARYADRADVYVSGNLLLYYRQGDSRAAVAPDVFVVFGVAKGQRRNYLLWEEGRPPTVVIEVSSRRTRRQDLHQKRDLYARLGVQEYFLVDPEGRHLRPALQGFRLAAGTFVAIPQQPGGVLRSDCLGLDLSLIDGRLALRDTTTGLPLPRPAQLAAELSRAQAEAARLREELAELRLRMPPGS